MCSQTSRIMGSACRDLGAGYSGVARANAQGVSDPEVTKTRSVMSQKSKGLKSEVRG